MRIARTLALSAAPLVTVALLGAAAPLDAATFHGSFTYADLSACAVMPAPSSVSGTWTVVAKDDGTARVHVLIHMNGRLHAVWTMPFQVQSQTATSVTATTAGIYPGDELSVTVSDGAFAYHLVSPAMGCDATMGGPQR